MCRDVRCQKQLWEISIRSVQEHLSSETLQNYNGVTAEDEELKKGKQQSTPPEPQQPEASTQEGSGGEKGSGSSGGEGERGTEDGNEVRGLMTSV